MFAVSCRHCGGASKVVETRKKDETIFRRRACKKCNWRWVTKEVIAKWRTTHANISRRPDDGHS